MKKYLYSVIVFFLIIVPITSKAESKYLYDVIKNEAESGGEAKEYTGDHQDTISGIGKEKIYHYYLNPIFTYSYTGNLSDKRNVIFGGYCWEMYRTTDSGGVRMIYNGVPYNGKCNSSSVSIGTSKYALYDEFESIGTAGYMHNKLYFPINGQISSYGSYSRSSTPLNMNDYNIILNDSGRFSFNSSSKKWETTFWGSSNDTVDLMKFKVKTDGDYILNYKKSGFYGYYYILKNDEIVMYTSSEKDVTVVLDGLNKDDEITIRYETFSGETSTFSFSMNSGYGPINDTRMMFGNSFRYENGMYTLVDTILTDGTSNIKNHHYTCLNHSGQCSKIYYFFYGTLGTRPLYYEIENGKSITDLVNEMLYDDNVNQIDSPVKSTIDTWYENNLIDYQNYIEDSIYCNNRNFTNNDDQGFNPNGGNTRVEILYSYSSNEELSNFYDEASSLFCKNKTDRFSVSNEYAKLKYPIALPTASEQLLLYDSYNNDQFIIRGKNVNYFTMTPNNYGYNLYVWINQNQGTLYPMYGADNFDVRPVITLKNGATYSSGNGSKDNPYVFDSVYSRVDIKLVNETESLNVEIEDLTRVEFEESVRFSVSPIKGFKLSNIEIVDEGNNEIDYSSTGTENEYVFTMPASNVTIIPTYERVSSSVTVEDNENTEEIIIKVNDAEAVLYEDKVKIKVTPKNGYSLSKLEIRDLEGNLVEYQETDDGEYEFIMPDTDVTITPVYEIVVPDTGKDKDYTIYIVAVVLIVLGIVFIIVNNIKNKKK